MPNDHRIAQLTGQPFGKPYFDTLLLDNSAVLDSEPPTAAILAAEQLASRGLDMLARLQKAHFFEGRRIAQVSVLIALAAELGLDAERFEHQLAQAEGDAVQRHIVATRALQTRVGFKGFPTFALERDGRLTVVDIGAHLGQPQAWVAWLGTQVSVINA